MLLLKSRASLTCFRACFLPGRAKDLSAPRYWMHLNDMFKKAVCNTGTEGWAWRRVNTNFEEFTRCLFLKENCDLLGAAKVALFRGGGGGGLTFEEIYVRLLCQNVFGIQDHSTEEGEDERNYTETRLSRFKLDLIRVRIRRSWHYNFRRGKRLVHRVCDIISRDRP